MLARIPEKGAYYRSMPAQLGVFSSIQKETSRFTQKGRILPRVYLAALSDVTVVLGMRQSIGLSDTWIR